MEGYFLRVSNEEGKTKSSRANPSSLGFALLDFVISDECRDSG